MRGRALVAHNRLGRCDLPLTEQGTRGPLKPGPFLASFLLWVDGTRGSSGFAADLRGGWLPLSGLSASHRVPDIFPSPNT